MSYPSSLYNSSLLLLTDFYQATMAYASWKSSRASLATVFNLYFRSNPFQGGYTIAAGLEPAFQFLDNFAFSPNDLDFLANLKERSGKILFDPGFITFLRESKFECDIEAVSEGEIVFPNEPVIKVRGPLWQCQWIESALLNMINFQSLIATKAARIVEVAGDTEVVEMGLRRAQGIDGSLSASRAAYVGGVSATSSILASRLFNIPLRGTHAHSWIMSFNSEEEAFAKYASALPNECLLLVDTYDTMRGIDNAIRTAKSLREKGASLLGIRLDSGDFAYLSQIARSKLDAEGFKAARIVASNELDEYVIQSLVHQNARIDVWGVGTKLVTAANQPAMNGVYKLTAVFEKGEWKPRIKVSDQPTKTSIPGCLRVRRYFNFRGEMEGDLLYDESESPMAVKHLLDPMVPHRHKNIDKDWPFTDLLTPVFRKGKRVLPEESLDIIRNRVSKGLRSLHSGIKRLENPHVYPVGLSHHVLKVRNELIQRSLES